MLKRRFKKILRQDIVGNYSLEDQWWQYQIQERARLSKTLTERLIAKKGGSLSAAIEF